MTKHIFKTTGWFLSGTFIGIGLGFDAGTAFFLGAIWVGLFS